MAQYQVVSRNLMHSSVHVTDSIYAGIKSKDRAKIIAEMIEETPSQPGDDLKAHPSQLHASGDPESLLTQVNPAEASRAIKILAERYL